jgi:hypothetical protein
MKKAVALTLALLMLASLMVVLAGCNGSGTLADGTWVSEERSFLVDGRRLYTADGRRMQIGNHSIDGNTFIENQPYGIRVTYTFERISRDEILLDGIRFVRQQ